MTQPEQPAEYQALLAKYQALLWEHAVLKMQLFGYLWVRQTRYPAKALIGWKR